MVIHHGLLDWEYYKDMKCDKCNTQIKENEKYFTAIGMNICEKCNKENSGHITLDFVLDHIRKNGGVPEPG